MGHITQHMIIFHNDKVLLSHRTIFWDVTWLNVLDKIIVRQINCDSVDLIEIDSIDEGSAVLFEQGQWATIREALHLINQHEFSALTRGFSLIRWDKSHQFCGRCAKQTILSGQAFERHCVDCQVNYYPRISPAIIVLIHHGDKILMARSGHFPPGVYGLIAGFVEAGETLEETVHREVLEEVGIKIKNLSYYGSQPWPFPDSLMIGFIAEYESGDIVIDHNELEDAGWYQYNQLPGLPSSSMSIAFKMLDQFTLDCVTKSLIS